MSLGNTSERGVVWEATRLFNNLENARCRLCCRFFSVMCSVGNKLGLLRDVASNRGLIIRGLNHKVLDVYLAFCDLKNDLKD